MPHTDLDWRGRATALAAIVPNVQDPMLVGGMDGRSRSRIVSQRLSRATILSCTRQLVAEQGVDNVHMQDVAVRSGLSIQTLYNIVGTRQEMVASAATEWVIAMARSAETMAQEVGGCATFSMLELFWAGAVNEETYGSMLVRSRAHRTQLEQPFLKTTKAVFQAQLVAIGRRNELAQWVDEELLAEALAISAHASISTWLISPYDEGRFYNAIVNGCGMMLRGALTGCEADRLEGALRNSIYLS